MTRITLQKTILASLLILSLLGCSRGTQPLATGAGDKTVVTFAAGPSLQSAYEPLIAAFNQSQPTIQVQFVPMSQDAQSNPDPAGQLQSMASAADTSL